MEKKQTIIITIIITITIMEIIIIIFQLITIQVVIIITKIKEDQIIIINHHLQLKIQMFGNLFQNQNQLKKKSNQIIIKISFKIKINLNNNQQKEMIEGTMRNHGKIMHRMKKIKKLKDKEKHFMIMFILMVEVLIVI